MRAAMRLHATLSIRGGGDGRGGAEQRTGRGEQGRYFGGGDIDFEREGAGGVDGFEGSCGTCVIAYCVMIDVVWVWQKSETFLPRASDFICLCFDHHVPW